MPTLRYQVYELLTPEAENPARNHIIDIFLSTLITLNIVAVVMGTEAWFEEKHRVSLISLEIFSVLVFTIEYILRIWSAPENPRFAGKRFARLRFALTPMALVDLIAIAPFYLLFFVVIDLRFVWALRLLRIVKFTRYSAALTMLQEVLREEASTILAGFFILLVMLTFSASGAWFAEHMAQPEHFGSIPQAMWWAIVTLTTVGYGDVYPVTTAGKIFGGCIAVVGVGIAALPAGILANGLNTRLLRARDEMLDKYRHALKDDFIDKEEAEELENLRRKLHLSRRDADRLRMRIEKERGRQQNSFCPHCGGEISPKQH